MTATKKPSIVFVHGIWADGSCFGKLIPPLQAEGYEVFAAQYGLESAAGDLVAVKYTLSRVSAPILLVGHSYGGTLITAAGTDPRVAGLVYSAALGPDSNETSQSQQDQFPRSEIFSRVDVAEGRAWMTREGADRRHMPGGEKDGRTATKWRHSPDPSAGVPNMVVNGAGFASASLLKPRSWH